jgi:hypothetical protein
MLAFRRVILAASEVNRMGFGSVQPSGNAPLVDIRMHDGSRLSASLPMSALGHRVRDHAASLQGAELTGFIDPGFAEVWIDFRYRGHRFSINAQLGEYWFFADDPDCPDAILHEFVRHFSALLGR